MPERRMSDLVRVDESNVESILDETFGIWHEGLSRPAYSTYWAGQVATQWGRKRLSRYALVDGADVLSSAKLYEYDATLDGHPLRIGGIGAVFTMPAQRGRGAGREVVERVTTLAAERGSDAALLFSDIGPDYYARLGFRTIPVRDVAVRVREDARRGAPAAMVRAGDDRDFDQIVAMDASRSKPFRFHLSRVRDVVHYAIAKRRLLAGLSSSGARSLLFFVAEEGASAVAYAVISVHGSAWSIDSCGDRDPAGARVGAILQTLIARDPGEQRPTITGWLPPNLRPFQLEIVDEQRAADVMMVRPLTDRARELMTISPDDVFFWRGDRF
jgi:predicted N-acetyltransferase YhbS